MTPDRALRVGIAGCGRIARALHIPGYVGSPHAEIVALYNHRLGTVADLAASHPGAAVYDDFDRFIDDSGVEALSVCTPNAMHAEMAIAALDRGIHVLVEKPMAMSLDEAQEMIDVASKSEAILMVGHTQRFYPAHVRAKQILDSGALGRIYQVRTTFGHAGPQRWSPRGSWFLSADLGGLGVIGDLAVHKVDLLRFLTGEEVTSVAGVETSADDSEVEENAAAVMVLAGGGLATLSVSWTLRGGNIDDLVLIGDHGSLRVRAEPGAPLVLYREDGERIEYTVHPGIPLSDAGEWLLDEIPQFIAAALGEVPNPVPGIDGYRALEIVTAISRSAKTGMTVPLPLPLADTGSPDRSSSSMGVAGILEIQRSRP